MKRESEPHARGNQRCHALRFRESLHQGPEEDEEAALAQARQVLEPLADEVATGAVDLYDEGA
jgi:hypothetical protein